LETWIQIDPRLATWAVVVKDLSEQVATGIENWNACAQGALFSSMAMTSDSSDVMIDVVAMHALETRRSVVLDDVEESD
jgi:hypothetical protein